MTEVGHNVFGGISAQRLRSFVERIERLEEEIGALNADKKEIYSEAKATGFDTKAIKMVVRMRKMDTSERQELEQLVDLYWTALDGGDPRVQVQAHVHEGEDGGEAQPEEQGSSNATDAGSSPAAPANGEEPEVEAEEPTEGDEDDDDLF